MRNNNDILLCAGGGLGAEEPRHAALAGNLSAGTHRSVPVSILEVPNLEIDVSIFLIGTSVAISSREAMFKHRFMIVS